MPDRRPRLLITRTLPRAVEARAAETYTAGLNPDDGGDTMADHLRRMADPDAVLVCPADRVDRATIAALPECVRIIATFSAGTDHIDLAAARDRGLVVTNTPDVTTDATAEIAMLCLLGAARLAREGQTLLYGGRWGGWMPTQLMGMGLGGKRLGIVGMGRIGQATACRARAFGMEIHYHNRHALPPGLAEPARYHADPRSLFAVSDVLSLHCPLTDQTRHLIREETIGWLPEGALLINTARGPLVRDPDLIAALRSGRLRAAGLDVFEGEPNLHPDYLTLPNVFLLPHQGSGTVETRTAMGFRALDNLDRFFADGTPGDRVA